MRRGYTLVELLIAATVALAVMAAAAALFAVFGRAASQSQAIVELGDRLRSTAWRLRQDLGGTTVRLSPPVRPEQNAGYFELVEGPRADADAADGTDTLQADTDDVILFTTRSSAGPFVGKFGTGFIESPVAEVAWFCRPAATQTADGVVLCNLYRKQLLVIGYVGMPPFSTANNTLPAVAPNTSLSAAWLSYDLSLRLEGSGGSAAFLPNTLADLTKRENRFWHDPSAFPHALQTSTLSAATFDGTARDGEDIVLTNVIGFDARVYDPEASSGDYVDLGRAGGTPVGLAAPFPPAGQSALQSAGVMVSNAPRNLALADRTYDTWSQHYEFDGVNQDGDAKTDEGADGFDDDADDLPDDSGEFETSPPYPVPLRGIEVRIRCYEPASRQIRQITIRHTFLSK